ncbi:uncharacterized protein LOC133899049 [Phragmites australis]|uniref:uncharacterized protein LOC133899049 n=1 Tax=Phragmites australis TaxID=29695 RepID=UPI002D79EFB8|nr:uncharacterized protein LOC133899049 [Phragmites australis]
MVSSSSGGVFVARRALPMGIDSLPIKSGLKTIPKTKSTGQILRRKKSVKIQTARSTQRDDARFGVSGTIWTMLREHVPARNAWFAEVRIRGGIASSIRVTLWRQARRLGVSQYAS